MMREAFSVGIVLVAKDMYSSFVAKAQRDITRLGQVSKVQADEFSRSLAKWQKFGAVGLGITAVSSKVAGVFEDMVRQAGQSESSISRAFISMGGSAGMSREKLALFFSQQQTQWGNMTEEVSGALVSARGRLGDTQKGLDAVSAATVLSAARNVDLGESVDLVTRMYGLFGGGITSANTTQGKMVVTATELGVALQALGGDTAALSELLNVLGVRGSGAGQSMETVLAIAGQLGAVGMGGRTSLAIIAMLDKLSEQRLGLGGQFGTEFPKTAATGSLLSFLEDLRDRFAKLGVTNHQTQVDMLSASDAFGNGGAAVGYLIDNLDKLKAGYANLAKADPAEQARMAAEQLNTWAGMQKVLNGRIAETKEMLGSGAVPIVKAFNQALGGALLIVGKSQGFDRLLTGVTAVVGLSAEVGKIAGPLMTGVSALQLWNLNQNLAAALTAKTTATVQAQQLSMLGLKGGLTGVVGLMGEIAAIGGTFLLGWNIGRAIGELTGLDDALQKFLGHLFHGNVELTKGQEEKVQAITSAIRAGHAASVPAADMTMYLRYQREISKYGEDEAQFSARMQRSGIPQAALTGAGFSLGTSPVKAGALAAVPNMFASGGPVRRTGLALVHAGEYVLPRHDAAGGGAYHAPGSHITVNLPAFVATGHLDYDVRALARAIIRILPTELKAQARRYA